VVSIVLPGQLTGADDGDRQGRHSSDGGRAAVVADGQAAEGQQPGDRPFHNPAVPAQTVTGVHPDASDPCGDATPTQITAHPPVVVGLVRVQLARPAPWPSPASALDRDTSPSRIGSTSMESWRLAPVIATARDSPSAVTSKWYLVPSLPRSVGLGPVSSPPFWPGCSPSPGTPWPSPAPRPGRASRARRGEASPTRPPSARPAAGASR
jgi:hypothetical protein